MEKQLFALCDILYKSHQYHAGDLLPSEEDEMINAWIESGAAKWREKTEPTPRIRAKPAAAQAGLTGAAVPAAEDALVGKPPQRRKTKKAGAEA